MHPLPPTEPRLQERYQKLVQEHMGHAHSVAAGPRSLPDTAEAFAATQAAWRFYCNAHLTLPQLAQPLLECAHHAVIEKCQHYVLVVHDWSHLDYRTHSRKKDRMVLGQAEELGYDLRPALLVSDVNGRPLAPACLDLAAADGVHSSRHDTLQPAQSCLDELAPVMRFIDAQGFTQRAVHIIDREADSVAHYREWHAAGHLFLVRADHDRIVKHEQQDRMFTEVVGRLDQRDAFTFTRDVEYHGRPARQFIAETEVTLDRPAQPHRRSGGRTKRVKVPGPPITLRLIVSRIHGPDGELLAEWLLLTNVPTEVSAAELALWYYWRWRVESFFKLLKSAGQHVEQWQQETAEAIARRLLVASMACVLVWQLAHSSAPEAKELRNLLVRLSGRQMEWGKEFTEPALLAGLWVLLAMLETLEHYPIAELRRMADFVLAGSNY